MNRPNDLQYLRATNCRWLVTLSCALAFSGVRAAAIDDPCSASPRCFAAETFTAEVLQMTASAVDARARHQVLTLNVRFRNVSEAPIILGYRARSGAAVDEFGNRYFWGRGGTYDTSAKGMGVVDSRKADTQFALQPGQTRHATFTLTRYNAKPPFGAAFNYDLVIDELELLHGQQVRTVRENSLMFMNLTPNTPAALGGGQPQSLGEALRGLKNALENKN